MAGAGVRWGQAGLLFIVVILAIVTCCSTPVANDINFLSNTGSSKKATDPNAGFHALQMGMTGYCNKGKCASYREFTANVKGTIKKTGINSAELKAVYIIAGKGAKLSNKVWLRLSILFGASTAVAFFSVILAFFLARGASPQSGGGGYEDYGGETPLLKTMRIIFAAFVFITFVMLLTAWALAHMNFNNAKNALMSNKEQGSFGNAWYIALMAFIFAFLTLALEGVAIAVQRGNGNQGYGQQGYENYG